MIALRKVTLEALKPLFADPQFEGALELYIEDREADAVKVYDTASDIRLVGRAQGARAELKLLRELRASIKDNEDRLRREAEQRRG